MAEISGIEMIQMLLKEVALLQKKVDLLDLNIKRLMNEGRPKPKAKAAEPPKEKPKEQKGIKNFKFETTQPKTKCMCNGKMIVNNNGNPTPLPGLSVKIYDGQNKIIKETKTNRSGEWRCALGVGKYCAEIQGKFGNKELYPANIVFEVLSGMEFLEVR